MSVLFECCSTRLSRVDIFLYMSHNIMYYCKYIGCDIQIYIIALLLPGESITSRLVKLSRCPMPKISSKSLEM